MLKKRKRVKKMMMMTNMAGRERERERERERKRERAKEREREREREREGEQMTVRRGHNANRNFRSHVVLRLARRGFNVQHAAHQLKQTNEQKRS
mgnify:CR=1 FL=1